MSASVWDTGSPSVLKDDGSAEQIADLVVVSEIAIERVVRYDASA
jgi:hypothetical protein